MADATPPEAADDPERLKREAEELDALVRALQSDEARDAPEIPAEYRYLDEKLKLQEIELRKQEIAVKRRHADQDIELRKTYAKSLLAILAVELVVVNVIFWVYAEEGKNWAIPDGVIQIWLGATVVQVVGIVTVVTKYLFPNRDKSESPPASLGGAGN